MDGMTDAQEIDAYIAKQIRIGDVRTKNAIIDRTTKKLLPKRSAILALKKTLRSFQSGNDPRWVAILGLRGVGKTTMISQLFQSIECDPTHKIYLSLDDAKNVLGASISEIIQGYERFLDINFEELDHPLYIFLDEVHFDPDWSLSLKTLVDKSSYIFLITTGSSVSEIRRALGSDTARRVVAETLHPLSFTEYLLLRDGKKPVNGLGEKLRNALYESTSSEEVYSRLLSLRADVKAYWEGITKDDVDKYIRYANLPFALNYDDNEQYIYQQIMQTIAIIVNKDIASSKKFDYSTVQKINRILYHIASMSSVSVNKVSSVHGIDRSVLMSVFEALEFASVLQRVYPYAQHKTQTTKPSKYLFVSSAYRAMYFNLVESTAQYDDYKGLLLEDVVGLYLSILTRQGIASAIGGLKVTYDGADNGADFIVSNGDKRISLEVGYGNKKATQANASSVRYKCAYGITVSSTLLSKSSDSVNVPLDYFLLTA